MIDISRNALSRWAIWFFHDGKGEGFQLSRMNQIILKEVNVFLKYEHRRSGILLNHIILKDKLDMRKNFLS